MMQPATRGGRREGSGRKSMGQVAKLYRLTPRHVEALERYRQQNQLASASEALRHLIEHHTREND